MAHGHSRNYTTLTDATRARYLHMIQLYADGSLGARPYASINLDAPLILLNPTHPQSNRTRPSNIAQACDLLPAMECYRRA